MDEIKLDCQNSTACLQWKLNQSELWKQHLFDPTIDIQFWSYGLVLPLISIVGMVANFLSILIFSQRHMHSVINTYLTGLSCLDFALLLFAAILYPSMAYCVKQKMPVACTVFKHSALVLYPLSLVARCGSVWCCVSITIDRFLAVKFPLKQRSSSSKRRARRILIGITICAFLYCIPTMFEVKLSHGHLERTQLRKSQLYTFIYKATMNLVILLIIPWTIMIVLNIFIVRAIKKAHINRRKISRHNRTVSNISVATNNERRSTVIAVLVCTTLLVSNLLPLTNNYIEEATKTYENLVAEFKVTKMYTVRRILVFLGNILICLNSATNFMIYYAFGPQYRKQFGKYVFRLKEVSGPSRSSRRQSSPFPNAAEVMYATVTVSDDRKHSVGGNFLTPKWRPKKESIAMDLWERRATSVN